MSKVYEVFSTVMGWVAVVKGENGVISSSLPETSAEVAYSKIAKFTNGATRSDGELDDIKARVRGYLEGDDVDLREVELDISDTAPFFKKVWEACRTIKPGEVRTYAWLAATAGQPTASRAAGQAMARNRWSLFIPCHRVVSSDKMLHGFGGSYGIALKERLLEMEGVSINHNRILMALGA